MVDRIRSMMSAIRSIVSTAMSHGTSRSIEAHNRSITTAIRSIIDRKRSITTTTRSIAVRKRSITRHIRSIPAPPLSHPQTPPKQKKPPSQKIWPESFP